MFQWLKAQFSRVPFLQASLRIIEGYGTLGAKRPAFRQQRGIDQFNGWVYAAAMLNARAAARIPLRLYVRNRSEGKPLYTTRRLTRRAKAYLAGDGSQAPSDIVMRKAGHFGEGVEVVIESHPVLELLHKVNPWRNGFDLQVLKFVYLELTGNAYWHPVIDPVRGIPSELWQMPPQWTYVIPGERGTDEFIRGYAYGQSAEKYPFAPDEVMHFMYPNPNSLYYGLGKVEAGWNIIQQNAAVHEYDTALWQNHARPDYAVIIKSGTDHNALTKFESDLNARLQGTRKSGQAFAMTGDLQIVPLAWPPKDLGGRTEIIEEVAAVFGVPVTKLKANDPNRANAETGDAGYYKETIHPMILHDEEKLNEALLPLFGIEDDAFLAYDNPVPEDRVFERDTIMQNVDRGLITRAEGRVEQGYEPEPEEGELLVPAGLVPISKVGETPMPGGFPFLLARPEPQPDTHAQIASAVNAASAYMVAASIEPVPKTLQVEISHKSMWRSSGYVCCKGDADDTVRDDESERFIQRFRAALADILADQTAAILNVLGSGGKTGPLVVIKADESDLFTLPQIAVQLDRFNGDLTDVLSRAIAEALGFGAEAGFDKIDFEGAFDVTNPAVGAFLDSYTPVLVRSLNSELARSVQNVVRDGVNAGLSTNAIRQNLEASPFFTSDGISGRAEMIARSESARAFVEGEMQGWEQSGVVKGKEWLLAPNPCEFCKALAAQFNKRTIGVRDSFYELGSVLTGTDGGKLKLDYTAIKGPPLHPNCRCDLVAVTE